MGSRLWNKYIKEELVKNGVPESKIKIFPSGVDLDEFSMSISKEDARKQISFPEGEIVTYIGHFYKWKGVDTLAETAKLIPDKKFVFVGGVEPDFEIFKKKALRESKALIYRDTMRNLRH